MKLTPLVLGAALLWAAMPALPAQASIVADFELNGSLANSAGGTAVLTNNGGVLGSTGITFGLNRGPTIAGLLPTSTYTIDMLFTLDSLNGPRGNGYVKLIDFSNLLSDGGFYSHGGRFSIYPLGDSADQVFTAGSPVRLTVSRDASGTVAGYINNQLLFSGSDPTDQSATTITAIPLNFFIDDTATGQGEASSGFVDYIRVFDTAITPGQAGPVPPQPTGAVPEPASWMMMIVGFAIAGIGFRSRKRREVLRFA